MRAGVKPAPTDSVNTFLEREDFFGILREMITVINLKITAINRRNRALNLKSRV